MIVKIDHIAFASNDLDVSRGTFETIGYKTSFIERNLQDIDNKIEFMRHFSGKLEMALMTRQGSIGIELLNHGHAVEEESYIFPVFEGLKFEMERGEDGFAFDGKSFIRVGSGFLGSGFFILEDRKKDEIRCNTVIVEVEDVEKSLLFWGNLGFKAVALLEQAARMAFKNPLVGVTYDLYLRQKKQRGSSFCLDSRGFNCIAFISSDPRKEQRKFESLGIETSEINRFRVDGKDLDIVWLRGPCGEIVEIIGLAR